MPRLEFIKDCINQDTKEQLHPGDVREVSDFEAGRHLAEGNAKLFEAPAREAEVETMTRRRGRRKKSGASDI